MQRGLGDARVSLTPALAEALLLHRWPYNVREVYKLAVQLRTFPSLERQEALAAQLRADAEREPDALPGDDGEPRASPGATTTPYAAPRIAGPPSASQLAAELEKHKGNVSALARALGISRRQLHRWLNQHQLSGTAFRYKKGPL